MLGIEEAKTLRNAINCMLFKGKIVVSLEDVAQMQPVPGTRISDSLTVLGLQLGNKTILVCVQFHEIGMRVRDVQVVEW